MDVFLNLTVSFYLPENSVSKAKKLADFLHEDLQKVIAKHVRGTSAEDLLHLAVYLDPRFRNHACLKAQERGKARDQLARWAYDLHESTSSLEEHFRAVAAHPDNRTLKQLQEEAGPRGQRGGRGRGRGRDSHGRGRSGRGRGGKIMPETCSTKFPQTARRVLKQCNSADNFLFGPTDVQPGIHAEASKEADAKQIKDSIQQQIQRMEALPTQPSLALDVLEWWKMRAVEFPDLARPAMYLLSIPPSSASVERSFSSAGRFVDRKRPRLRARTASDILFAHENLKRGWTGEEHFQKRVKLHHSEPEATNAGA